MVFQKNVTNGRSAVHESPIKRARRSVAGFAHDVISLSQLQLQLLLVDIQEASGRIRLPLVACVIASLLTVGALPVLLLGIGWYLSESTELSRGGALLLTAAVSLIIALGLLWWGATKVNAASKLLSRSRREFSENVLWVKRALNQQHVDLD